MTSRRHFLLSDRNINQVEYLDRDVIERHYMFVLARGSRRRKSMWRAIHFVHSTAAAVAAAEAHMRNFQIIKRNDGTSENIKRTNRNCTLYPYKSTWIYIIQ